MTFGPWLLVVHATATLFMTGLVWFVQTVHYPLFAHVARGSFPAYEREHQRRTSWIVVPWMLAEAASALLLALAPPPAIPAWMPALGLLLLVLVWLSTGLFMVPAHFRLERGFDRVTHRLLVQGNTVRTMLWSARGVLAVAMIQMALSAGASPSGWVAVDWALSGVY